MNCNSKSARGNLLCELDRGLNRIVRDALTPSGTSPSYPPVSVFECEKHYVVECDLPGFASDQISVQTEDGVLVISAERKAAEKQEGVNVLHDERRYSRLVRRLQLAKDVNVDGIDAEYTAGVLKVSILKNEQMVPRRVQIRTPHA
jgi:HSP20 family protein